MSVTATKRSELVLSEGNRKFYDECWIIAYKTLQKLDIDTAFLEKIKDPDELIKAAKQNVKAYRGIAEAEAKLNSIFASKNNLPEKIVDDKDFLNSLSNYIEKNFGVKLDLVVTKSSVAATAGMKTIMLSEGDFTLHTVYSIPHERRHLDEPYNKKMAELDAIVSPVFGIPTQLGRVIFWSDLTGASLNDVIAKQNIQTIGYSYTNATVFLIHLYDVGLCDEEKIKNIKPNLEFSRFYLDPELRRASIRFSEGDAISATIDSLSSNDNALRAYAALEFLYAMSKSTPQLYAEKGDKFLAAQTRKMEGFRYYLNLCDKLADDNITGIFERIKNGEQKLKGFKEECGRTDNIPCIDIDGNVGVIDPRERKMFRVDMDKLKAGIIDIEELIIKPDDLTSKLPKNLN